MFSYQLNPQEVNNEFALLNKVGTVKSFAGSTPPDGWLFCDGAAISRTTYAALFAVIGTIYGAGDGSTTFNLPNLIILGTTAPVIGTGAGLGIQSTFTTVQGIFAAKWTGNTGTSDAVSAVPGNISTPAGTTVGGNIVVNNDTIIGISQDPNYSGLIASLSEATQTARAIIKY